MAAVKPRYWVITIGIVALLGIGACSRGSEPIASPTLTPVLDPTPALTATPAKQSTPTRTKQPTPAPTKRPTLAPTTIVAGYTRKEEPCDSESRTVSSVYYEMLGVGLCAFYYPPEVQAGTVPFKRISKGDRTDPPIKKPTLLVSGVNEGMKASVFLGFQATGGYGISVVKVSAEEGHIRLTVVVTSPLPRQSRTQVLTYPYDVVVIAEEDIVSPPGTKWSVVTEDGTVLAETVYPAE